MSEHVEGQTLDGPCACLRKVTQLLSNQPGPLPLARNFSANGGVVLLRVAGSGFAHAPGIVGMDVEVNGTVVGDVKVFTNEHGSHKSFVARTLVAGPLPAANHSVILRARPGTQTDFNDFFCVTIEEFR